MGEWALFFYLKYDFFLSLIEFPLCIPLKLFEKHSQTNTLSTYIVFSNCREETKEHLSEEVGGSQHGDEMLFLAQLYTGISGTVVGEGWGLCEVGWRKWGESKSWRTTGGRRQWVEGRPLSTTRVQVLLVPHLVLLAAEASKKQISLTLTCVPHSCGSVSTDTRAWTG